MYTLKNILRLFIIIVIVSGCNNQNNSQSINKKEKVKDSIIFSFSFVGCNRVQYGDWYNKKATNTSTANISVLKRIFDDVSNQKKKPSLFFFLGDLVLAESDTVNLKSQLNSWLEMYHDKSYSSISTSGIELIAVPGNHEMLFYDVTDDKEYPLKGATEIWMRYMKPYMPVDRTHITGRDSIVNQMTFSFSRANVGFVVMNTDTYNSPTKENPKGSEGVIPTQWIVQQVEQFRKDPIIDHIFVLGHKPYYIDGKPETGHKGLPEGPVLWPQLQKNNVIALLSAHVHDYDRMQPDGKGTYQIIAGNGGSDGSASFFGYSTIHILSNGEVQYVARGLDKGNPYYRVVSSNKMKVKDSTILTWTKNSNPYLKN